MTGSGSGGGGLLARFARHRTAANLVLALMVVTGLAALARINRQFFPDFGIDVISVTVSWPGAATEDVDRNVVQVLEPELRFLDGVDRIRATAYEGLARLVLEFTPGHDMQQALSDVEAAVSRVTTLPEDSERPQVRRHLRYDTIARVVLWGPLPQRELERHARRVRDRLLGAGLTRVTLAGTRDDEIWVELPRAALHRFDLTPGELARRTGALLRDIPSGELGRGEERVRTLGLRRDAQAVARLPVVALPDGRTLRLQDIASVHEAAQRHAPAFRHRGMPAVELHVQRATTADALEQAETLQHALSQIRPTLPAGLQMAVYDVESDYVRDRIALLLRNGATGLALVLLVLFVFLNGRVAFWVAAGIPASLLATVALMDVSGQSINLMSLFGLIMAVGIVVDDAIVVGEHAETLHQRDRMPPLAAAVAGAQRMLAPVVSATLTTIAAFMPLLLIGGVIGQIIVALPLVVICVLLASLVECFLVLPGHLRAALGPHRHAWSALTRFRAAFDARFDRLRAGPFRRLVAVAVDWRYTTLALAVALFVAALGLLASGRVGYRFFPEPEADRIYANLELVASASRDETQAALDALEAAAYEAERRLAAPGSLVRMSLVKVGQQVGGRGPRFAAETDTFGGVVVELVAADRRTVDSHRFAAAWRAAFRPPPGTVSVTVRGSRAGPPGEDIDIRLIGATPGALKAAAEALAEQLRRYPGVRDVADDLPWGKPETLLTLSPLGRALGLDATALGRQLRDALEGAIATRFTRDEEDVPVRVLLAGEDRGPDLVERLHVRTPEGALAALGDVAHFERRIGFARIRREDGRREVAVTASLDPTVTNGRRVIAALERDGLAALAARHGVDYRFGGRAEEERDTVGDMEVGAALGLALIYIVLSWVFASYTRPLVVMSIIPLALVGAVLGHWVMGHQLSILSFMALMGLAGIVVNDSIILVTTIDRRARRQPWREAVIDGTVDRLRAVLLTSATTIGGLAPLMAERSLQAQFLVPMAITICFGLAVTTVLVLLLVPALIAVQHDLGALRRRRRTPQPAGAVG